MSNSSAANVKVLFVDDKAAIREQAKKFLEKKNERLEVNVAKSAEKGLEMLKDDRYDAIVSDYDMPGADGLEFFKEVRGEYGEEIVFMILTGKGEEKVAMEATNLGVDRYFMKLLDPSAQYDKISKALVEEVKTSKTPREKALEKVSVPIGIAVLVTGSENYRETLMDALEKIKEEGGPGIYISVNKPHKALEKGMEEKGIDPDDFRYIDLASTPSPKEKKESERVEFMDSPGNLTGLSIKISEVVEESPEDIKFIFFDSVSALMKHTSQDRLSKFFSSLSGKIWEWEIGGIFVTLKEETSDSFLASLVQNSDKMVEL